MDDNQPNRKKARTTTMESTSTCVVRFNVGGTKYEVSKSLIETYPTTMLARLVSDTWQNDDRANEKNREEREIFIDRSGSRFQYVLDYMRDLKVHLPINFTTKTAVLQELEYFGFDNVPPDSIDTCVVNIYAADQLLKCEKTHKEELAKLDGDIAKLRSDAVKMERTKEYTILAHHCFKLYCKDGNLNFNFDPSEGAMRALVRAAEQLPKERDIFDACLQKYGLRFDNGRKLIHGVQCFLTLSKVEEV